jgi:hypothetical protein
MSQTHVDPDEIFKLHQKTCPLNEVFSSQGTARSSPASLTSHTLIM